MEDFEYDNSKNDDDDDRSSIEAINEYDRIINFLQLNNNSSSSNNNNNKSTTRKEDDEERMKIKTMLQKSFDRSGSNKNYINNDNVPPLKKETRLMLEQFFKPYNQRLTKLLNENGFHGDWYERWK